MDHLGLHLRRIYFSRLSGELTVLFGRIEKHLYFNNGDLVFAKTNQPGERLGEILFKLGKISEDTFLKIESYIEPKQNIGKILLRRGLLSERNLQEGLVYQMKEITLNLFNSFEATSTFVEKKTIVCPLPEETRIPTPQLIEDGIRLMKLHPKLSAFLEDKIPYIKNKTFLHVLTEEERDLLTRISGRASAKALLRATNLEPDFFWRTLYLFYCLDLVDFQGEAESWQREGKETEVDWPVELGEVLEFYSRLGGLNYYEMLGVGKRATEEEIKKAYFHLARQYHPDRFGPEMPAAYRDKVNHLFDQVTKAYRVLTNIEARRAYDLALAAEGRIDERSAAAQAEHRFRQGRTLFNQGRFEEAVIYLEECVRLNRHKADYLLLLAMAEAKIPALKRKAELDFLRVQQLEPWNAEGYVGLGILYKQEGLAVKASRQFQKALQVDPQHRIARQELEAVGGKTKQTKGLFSFFKKK